MKRLLSLSVLAAALVCGTAQAQMTDGVIKIGVTQMPGSGTPEELRDWAGISADAIAGTVRSLLR